MSGAPRRAAVGIGVSALIALGSWAGGAVLLDAYGGRAPDDGTYDAIVVAGAGVMPGGVPGDALVARTDAAVALWREGRAPRIAFTGGVGDWGPAESEVAAGLARAAGVPASAIVVEDQSRNTEENALHIAAVLGDVPVLVVTDRFHALRCERVFGRYFHRVEVVGVTSPLGLRVRGALREVAAVGWYGARGRL